MFCPSCGVEANGAARFCTQCGDPLPVRSSAGHAGSLPSYATSPTYGAPAGFGIPPGQDGPLARTAQVPATPLAPFGAPLAGWWQRVGALVLDILILDLPYLFIYAIATSATHTTVDGVTRNNTAVVAALLLAFFAAQGLYFTLLNGTRHGQTPGNRAPGISVRDLRTGAAIGAGRGFLRWFVRVLLYVLVIPGIVNDLMPLWSRHRQTIADKVANSVMVKV